MDLNTYSYETVPLHNHDNPISIDFDSLNQQIYWTDVGSNQIRTSSITGSNEKVVRQLGASKATIFIDRIFKTLTLGYDYFIIYLLHE